MVTNICLLLEAVSMVLCLHYLYDEKFRLDIATTSYLSIYMIIMTFLNYYRLPRGYSMIIYPVLAVYCGFRFGRELKSILINMALCVVIVGGIQMLITLPLCIILNKQLFKDYELLFISCLTLLSIVLLLPKCRINKISSFLQKVEKTLFIALAVGITLIIIFLLIYKDFTLLEFRQAILLFASIVFIFVLAEQLSASKVRAKEVETELRMHKVYADSFQGLIKNIRLRQHEFDNHIATIYSQHYIYKSHEELIEAQKNYCQMVTKENCFNKLLSTGNPIIIGFLYGKFIEIDKMGIDIVYNISIDEMEIGIPIYKIIEILGNLISNAVEAIQDIEGSNKLYVSIVEEKNKMEIEVRNESPFISHDKINFFFIKGYSSKGENRGLGLYNVKNICEEYSMKIYCENLEIDNINWFSCRIIKKEETN